MPLTPAEVEKIFRHITKYGGSLRTAQRAVVRNKRVRTTPNANPMLAIIGRAAEGAPVRLHHKEEVGSLDNTPIGELVRFRAEQYNNPRLLGTIGELLPSLARTRAGHDLSDVKLRIGTRPFSQYSPSMDAIDIGTAMDAERPGLTRAQDVATTLTHELSHAEQHRAGVQFEDPEVFPYYQLPHEISARRVEASATPKLLRGEKGPLFSFAAPSILNALHEWSTTKQDQPLPEFVRGAVSGLSPTGALPSASEASEVANLWRHPSPERVGKAAEQGAAYIAQVLGGAGDMLRNPLLSVMGLLRAALDNPAGSAGQLVAMALPFPGGKFGGKRNKLTPAEVRAKMAESYEGQASHGPLDLGPPTQGWEESLGDMRLQLQRTSDEAILHAWQSADAAGLSPQERQLVRSELERRGIRGDIADFEHLAQEGRPAALDDWNARYASIHKPWTREERGAEELRRLGIEMPPHISRTPDGGLNALVRDNYDEKTQRIAGQEFLYNNAQDARDVAFILKKEFPNAPPGQRMWRNGEQWVNTRKGWTRNIDAPKPQGIGAPPDLIAQVARVTKERGAAWGAEEAIRHGGLAPRAASALIANTLAAWSHAGVKLSAEQNAWLELYRAGKYTPPTP